MHRRIAYAGARFTVAFAERSDGSSDAGVFYDTLGDTDKAKLLKLFEYLGDQGHITNREKFKKIADGFFEFKSFQVRMPCVFTADGQVLVTHGFTKKGDEFPSSEIERAKRIVAEDAARARELARAAMRSRNPK
jgi:phage-related protein